jgi:F-type H+-transporting ATPase subunit b
MRTYLAGLVLPLCLSVVVCLSPQPSLSAAEAADGAGAAAEHGDAHGHDNAHEGPESPITAKKQDVDLAIWTLVVFVVFLAVLKHFAWGPLNEALNKRETRILQNLADAESARVKAEKLLAAHAEKLDLVQDEVREILAEARRDAEHTKSDIIATAQKEAEATRKRAVQEIEQARDQALDELFSQLSQTVTAATEQVLGRGMTTADDKRLIQEVVDEFSSHGT